MSSSYKTPKSFQIPPCMVDWHHGQLMKLSLDELVEISKSQGRNPQEEVSDTFEAIKMHKLIVSTLD